MFAGRQPSPDGKRRVRYRLPAQVSNHRFPQRGAAKIRRFFGIRQTNLSKAPRALPMRQRFTAAGRSLSPIQSISNQVPAVRSGQRSFKMLCFSRFVYNAFTAWRKVSPRSSKFLNASNDAQAGESRTTSPEHVFVRASHTASGSDCTRQTSGASAR